MSFKQLANLPVLKRLDDESLQAVYETGSLEYLKTHQLILTQNAPADSIIWLISGRIKTYVEINDQDVVLDILGPEQKIGLVEVCEGGSMIFSATCLEDCLIFRLSKDGFQDLLDRYFDFQMAVYANISYEMRLVVNEINELKQKNTAKRLATFLLGMTDRETGAFEINLPYDKQLLAARLAMKPESLSRALAKLKQVGVSTDGATIHLKDISVLRNFCGEEIYE